MKRADFIVTNKTTGEELEVFSRKGNVSIDELAADIITISNKTATDPEEMQILIDFQEDMEG